MPSYQLSFISVPYNFFASQYSEPNFESKSKYSKTLGLP